MPPAIFPFFGFLFLVRPWGHQPSDGSNHFKSLMSFNTGSLAWFHIRRKCALIFMLNRQHLFIFNKIHIKSFFCIKFHKYSLPTTYMIRGLFNLGIKTDINLVVSLIWQFSRVAMALSIFIYRCAHSRLRFSGCIVRKFTIHYVQDSLM